jgi:hypothetical protein
MEQEFKFLQRCTNSQKAHEKVLDLLAIRKMQIKTTMICHFSLTKIIITKKKITSLNGDLE